jgi:hypothetical protein
MKRISGFVSLFCAPLLWRWNYIVGANCQTLDSIFSPNFYKNKQIPRNKSQQGWARMVIIGQLANASAVTLGNWTQHPATHAPVFRFKGPPVFVTFSPQVRLPQPTESTQMGILASDKTSPYFAKGRPTCSQSSDFVGKVQYTGQEEWQTYCRAWIGKWANDLQQTEKQWSQFNY